MISPKTNQEMWRAEQVPPSTAEYPSAFLICYYCMEEGDRKGLGDYQILLRGQSHARQIE